MSKKAPFTILALGDSVVWGEGLAEKDKFTTLVAKGIEKQLGRKTKMVSFAHAGAEIQGKKKGIPFRIAESIKKHGYESELRFIDGEIGQLNPNIATQVRIAAQDKGYAEYLEPHASDSPAHARRKKHLRQFTKEPSSPDLIILNGGANDFRPYRVFAPFTEEVQKKSDSKVVTELMRRLKLHARRGSYTAMIHRIFHRRFTSLLKDARSRWPTTPIIVTGYYPMFTKGSFEGKEDATVPLMLYALLRMEKVAIPSYRLLKSYIELYTLFGRKFLEKRSALFDTTHKTAMKRACNEVHTKKAPIHFVTPSFGPENGAFAKNTFLFGLEPYELDMKDFPRVLDVLSTQDAMEKPRKKATDTYLKVFKKEMRIREVIERKARAYRNAVAHPNKKGAKAYAEAIMSECKKMGIVV